MKPTIGLEIHFELNTKSKMFCGCPSDHFGKKPNTQTCPVCLGLPGALPVPNKKAIDWTIMIGLSLNCTINKNTKFDRKHYFYPDLPKGYQISQYDEPICVNGKVKTDSGTVRITRVHLEEDTGKLKHRTIKNKNVSLIDFNRSGVPLVEIVTEPDIKNALHAKEFAQQLQNVIRFLGISNCDMEKGSMRLEANISWGLNLGYKVEVKNLNSFKFVEKAIEYDLKRQKKIIDKGETPKQETRGWDEKAKKTVSQRYKETEADYRYFPEPDIPPISITQKDIDEIKKNLPLLPKKYIEIMTKKYDIREDFSNQIVQEKNKAKYALIAFKIAEEKGVDTKIVADYLINKNVDINKVDEKDLIKKIIEKYKGKITDKLELESLATMAIKQTPKAVIDYKKGNKNAISAIVGKVMKLSSGRADAKLVHEIILKKIK